MSARNSSGRAKPRASYVQQRKEVEVDADYRALSSCEPCPFCAATSEAFSMPAHELNGCAPPENVFWTVDCSCGACGPSDSDKDRAIELWNARRRVPANPLLDRTAETLGRIAIMQTWLLYRPLRQAPDGGYSEHDLDTLRQGDVLIHDLIRDAAQFESRRAKGG